MNNEIVSFIDSIEEEVKKSQNSFFYKWNLIIRHYFNFDTDFKIENYIDCFGGYWLDSTSYSKLDKQLIHFYDLRVKKGKVIYLRGYDYYKADPLFHLRKNVYKFHDSWSVFRKKWKEYRLIRSFDFLCENISLENWIGCLGLLEYLFEDLTVIRWFIFRNNEMLLDIFSEKFIEIVKTVEAFTDIVGECLAGLLKFDFRRVNLLLTHYYHAYLESMLIIDLLEGDYDCIDKSSTRTMREGDSLVLIYAAYIMKLNPACKRHQWKRIKLISNAFGAMNTGLILKHLISPLCEVEHINILYAQHRAEEDLIYEDTLINKCYYLDQKEHQYNDTDAIFIIDDSVCLGRSYGYIKNFIAYENVYLLPLTFNCNGLKYFRVSISKDDDLDSIIHQSIKWAREVNNTLPAFFSFWDFRKTVPEGPSTEDKNYRLAKYGSDLLLNHLWEIYNKEIFAYGKE